MEIFPPRMRIAILLVVVILGIVAASQGIDERKATLGVLVAYGLFYGAFRLFRKYKDGGDLRGS